MSRKSAFVAFEGMYRFSIQCFFSIL
ncbi:hypothetical protein FHS90_003123, partial [Rufibacter quisquiliarum]|nr:hypothetical protein [Rufibacter quisquiliarum]